jgi:hypothetical protein
MKVAKSGKKIIKAQIAKNYLMGYTCETCVFKSNLAVHQYYCTLRDLDGIKSDEDEWNNKPNPWTAIDFSRKAEKKIVQLNDTCVNYMEDEPCQTS